MSGSHSSKRTTSRIRLEVFFPTVEQIFRDVPPKIRYPFTFTPTILPNDSLLLIVWHFDAEHQFTRECFEICRIAGVVRHSPISADLDSSDLQAAEKTTEGFGKYSYPFHFKSMEFLDLKNKNSPGVTPDNNKYVVLLRLICITWESYFPSPTLLEPYVYDNMDPRVTNLLKLTQTRPAARSALGFNPKIWQRLSNVFREGIISLMQSSFPQTNPISPTANGTSSALISANFASLIKNIDRLNDLCTIARNMLATNELAQDLAAMAKFEKQIMMLIDTCVRVTARGYDGPIDGGDRQSQERWQKVVAAYKKLLITCLQFLHNFIMHNENRKLGLWMDLFNLSTSSDPLFVQNDMGNLRRRTLENGGLHNCVADREREKLKREIEAAVNKLPNISSSKEDLPPSATADSGTKTEAISQGGKQSLIDATSMGQDRRTRPGDNTANKVPNTAKVPEIDNTVENTEKLPTVEDMEIHPASEAASNLENAKQCLMESIRDNSQMHIGEEREADGAFGSKDGAGPDEIFDSNVEDGEDDEDEDDEEREEGYRGPGDQERGLLTDIPLVLAPTEIEALPMILQAGIVPQFGDKTMQNARCNILLAQESGRNLLRELLIFVAAWDLPDEEIYFRLMQQIMQAILENGLMPLAYTTFGEIKDIISPAQAVMLKILTQIFRAKHSSQETDSSTSSSNNTSTGPNANPAPPSSNRFDTTIIKFIFSVFRQTVIPQTCALIFLQGQIRGGQATPEDFPLNLWDMERVYEGVYQFLEFFAVLAEDPAWKKLLVKWEIVHELIALLKELESGIPRASLSKSGQRGVIPSANPPASAQQSIVERPYDSANENSATAEAHGGEEDDGHGMLGVENPEDFEWRNLKKLVVLVLSSLVWKSPEVQNQVRENGGVEAVLGCCSYDGNNPYIREHAIMCLRFLLEANADNQQIVRELEARQVVPSEVLDKRAYETFIDVNGRVGLRRKGSAPMVG